MQKKELLFLILGIFLISFASAQSSLDLGSIFDSSLIIYGGTFVIFFAFINFLLGKSIFKGDESKTTRIVISLVVSLMSVYGLSTGEFLSGFGTGYVGNFFVGDILPTILTIIFIAGIVFFIWKWGFSNVLMILGALSIIVSLTNLAYEKNVFFVLGIIFLVIGLLLKFRKPKIGGWKWGRNRNLPPGAPPQSRIDALISEAKKFRRWADSQRNPKFYRSWAHFVGKLGGESRIMRNYNVSSRDIQKVVRDFII
ncbi:MAG: hypothetical protein QT10_C0005G0010 [archaeon GW2011_AR19]|nr:MAG: hypothetical protein QT10_C0005G0010 [archaeon GW2011_AR19]